jgi:benzoyl-CoA reductase/2-hydroxyglutaryl-CoA dehydratase subunit BcrC/BadD/HgdB
MEQLLMRKVGFTTTIPVEVILAAGCKPVDLNNVFITDENYSKYIDMAEKDGFPKSTCAWIKGIYGVCVSNNVDEVIGVVEGDCSNTKALMEVLRLKGIKVQPFSFPHSHRIEDIKNEINRFIEAFDVQLEEVENVRRNLQRVRQLVKKVDELTYIENKATGFENHLFQVSMSDFNGCVETYENWLEQVVSKISNRKPSDAKLRLGFLGVPPMTGDIYEFVEKFDAHFVYNEVQREFAFPRSSEASNIFEQYYDYTYPYDIDFRLREIKSQIDLRKIDAIVHYTQAFCYRAIEDIILREKLNIPVINIEGDKLNSLDARTKLRLEAFLDMLSDVKERAG